MKYSRCLYLPTRYSVKCCRSVAATHLNVNMCFNFFLNKNSRNNGLSVCNYFINIIKKGGIGWYFHPYFYNMQCRTNHRLVELFFFSVCLSVTFSITRVIKYMCYHHHRLYVLRVRIVSFSVATRANHSKVKTKNNNKGSNITRETNQFHGY